MRGKKRPLSERRKAVGIALVEGPQVASEMTGIPRPTIIGWSKLPEFDELRQKTPEAVSDMFWAAVQIGVDQVATGLLGDEPLRDKAVALGILYDKHALMTGQVTVRSEARDLTKEFDDHELDLLRDAIEREDSTRAAAEAAVVGDRPQGSTPTER
jgi:hypothetical protein